jgi:hypothetical protein
MSLMPTSLSCDPIIPENAIPADGLEIILGSHDPLANVSDQVEQAMHSTILMSGSSEIMFPAHSGMEIVPLYPVPYGSYQDHYSPMPL